MSIHNSPQNMPVKGFTISQTTLGATLQFEPALNSAELDAMIDAYVAGSDTIQQKRATVCVEFFSYAAQTGQTNDLQLFFPVYPTAFSTESPASLSDSGCGSGFDVSPVVSDMTWDSFTMAAPATPATPATPSSAFVAPSQNRVTKPKAAGSSRKAGSRATANDFSHIPGMKILTKDGVDVTNSASRGSKTKAMREHAHLIRLLKACDSCKKKKVRCDPSHKRRASGPAPTAVEATKAKKTKSASPPVTPQAEPAAQQASFQVASAETTPFEAQLESLDSFDWEKFMQPEDDIFSLPIDYNYTLDARGFLTPSSGSSCSPSQPFTPAPAVGLASFEAHDSFAAGSLDLQAHLQQPQLPYLYNDGHTGDYVDFTLYSPASSFLDEELQEMQSTGPSPSSAFIGWSSEPAVTGHERIERQEGAENRHSPQRVRAVSPSAALDRGASDPDRPPRVPDRDDPECAGGVLGSRHANPGDANLVAAHNSLGGAGSIQTSPSIRANIATSEKASCGQDIHGCGGGGDHGDVQSQQHLLGTFSTLGPKRERKRQTVLSTTLSPDQQSWSSSVSSETILTSLSVPLAPSAPRVSQNKARRSELVNTNEIVETANAFNAGYMVALAPKMAVLAAVTLGGTEGRSTPTTAISAVMQPSSGTLPSQSSSNRFSKKQKVVSSNIQSWAMLAPLGFMLALAKHAQEASALLPIVALVAASALLQQLGSQYSVSSTQFLSSRDQSKATASGSVNGNSAKLTTQLDGLRSAASHRMSRCLRQWTAICGC
ncbi:hypothetical protein GGTG_04856 [Gaeumannomyces tritici R3-111a-1]|uniref:Uncharacterized protein n=1 Tax=Gaeumannomyces tritici (strain R3-111a-1) TaxID=644352 RepID=J3NUA2_GAET3|nr:hypothetical protein GGTG_04856 [Gaeumannomyces tritici R3-111a-1]EJT79773.1 hypothetical protein GGTG_04856 [Gaeumannomyces tritici R3-111a-1]